MNSKSSRGSERRHTLPRNAKIVAAARSRPDGGRDWQVEGVRGLVLRCPVKFDPSRDTAVWYFRYQTGSGKRRIQRMIKIAKRADIDLSSAIAKADEYRASIVFGADPAAERHARREALTCTDLIDRFLSENTLLTDSTKKTYRYGLEKDVRPVIGRKAARDVTEGDVVAILQRIESRGTATQADHTRTAISSMFSWAKRERFVPANPCRDVERRAPKVARNRTPSDDELVTLWQGADSAPQISTAMRRIIKLAILTGQRRTEVAGARISELSGLDGDTPIWTIPGDKRIRGKTQRGRMKGRLEQVLPLSRQAAAAFVVAMSGARDEWLFPADLARVRIGKTPRTPHINGESVSKAMRRLRKAKRVEDISLHDMRRAISNWLKNEGVGREVRDLILAHKDGSVTEAHYTQSARMEVQVREAMQMWADHVDALIAQRS